MDAAPFNRWLADYGRAWEQKDTEAFIALFTPDVHYYWTPFEEPRVGRSAVGQAFEAAVARQSHIRFTASALTPEPPHLARWQCSFTRVGSGHTVRLDGIFLVEFGESGLCSVFREWWHTDEAV